MNNAKIDLNAEAMLNRLESMKTQADAVYQQITKTSGVMEELKTYFTGTSATNLQQKHESLESTYASLLSYLEGKIAEMQTLTGNIQRVDEEV